MADELREVVELDLLEPGALLQLVPERELVCDLRVKLNKVFI